MGHPPDICGVLLVDKPAGPTSFGVVAAVKRAFHVRSAGHTGTLDPNASGLLPICLGDATRIASFLTDGSKLYQGVVRFGIATDSQDALGKVVAEKDPGGLTRADVEREVSLLVGRQQQIVPMFSAHKVAGRRLYELAREGVEVERPTQEITVEEASLTAWSPPDATLRVGCSKGTYIRSLAALLGERLGCGAHLLALRRLASGSLNVERAIPLDELLRLAESAPERAKALILSVEEALADLPECRLDDRRAAGVAFGNQLGPADRLACGAPELPAGSRLRLCDRAGRIIAVGEAEPSGGIRLLRVLCARSGPGPGG